ncbi:MAG: hypothetical protein AAF958_02675 [Planctomycetota bacterium]
MNDADIERLLRQAKFEPADADTLLRWLRAADRESANTRAAANAGPVRVPLNAALAAGIAACFVSVFATLAFSPVNAPDDTDAGASPPAAYAVGDSGFDRFRVTVVRNASFTSRYSNIERDPITRWQQRQQ